MNNSSTPLVSIITVCKNESDVILRTLLSVASQDYSAIEHIVIDGGSSDGTIQIVESFVPSVTLFISEKDSGIYDAMNKGLRLASGNWLHFLNAGDIYTSSHSLTSAIELTSSEIDFVYSDTKVIGLERNYVSKASVTPLNIIHQSLIYRKSLHDSTGPYLVCHGLTISDYIFMSQIYSRGSIKSPTPISVFYEGGVSTNIRHFYQKISWDFMQGRLGRIRVAILLLLYPCYRHIKKLLARLFCGNFKINYS